MRGNIEIVSVPDGTAGPGHTADNLPDWNPIGGGSNVTAQLVGSRRPAGGSMGSPLRSPHVALAVVGAAEGQSLASDNLRGGIRVQHRQRATFRLVPDQAGGLSSQLAWGYPLYCRRGGHGAGSNGEHLGGLLPGRTAKSVPGTGRPAHPRPVQAGFVSQSDGGNAGVGWIRIDVLVAAGAVLRDLDLGEPYTACLVATPMVSPAVRKLPQKSAGSDTRAAVIRI